MFPSLGLPRVVVSALSFTTEPQYRERAKTQVRQRFEEMGFDPGSRMLDEGTWELDGERAYYGIFVESAAGFPRTDLLIVALVGDRSYYFWLFARPRDFEALLPTARAMADSLEIQGGSGRSLGTSRPAPPGASGPPRVDQELCEGRAK